MFTTHGIVEISEEVPESIVRGYRTLEDERPLVRVIRARSDAAS